LEHVIAACGEASSQGPETTARISALLYPSRWQRLPFHYGWLVVFASMLCIFAGLGLGRFAIGMLLPSMQSSLGLSYSQMGWISTGNFVGYMLAVSVSGFLVDYFGNRRLIAAALVLVGASMLMISQSLTFGLLFFWYLLTGIGSGLANVPTMALIPAWFSRKKRGRASGFVVIGSGFAILLSGRLIPFLNNQYGAQGWKAGWIVLGCLVLLVAVVCHALLRNSPAEKGLLPCGAGEDLFGEDFLLPRQEHANPPGLFPRLGSLYFLFGFTYVIYATFLVTTMVQERGLSEIAAGTLWSWVGFFSLFSGPVFGTLSDRIGRRAGLMTVYSIQALAFLLVGLPLGKNFLFLSIACFGLTAWSIPSIMAATVGDYYGAGRAARVFGLITFIFAIGQISGPALAGFVAELSGSFADAYLAAAFFGLIAVLVSAGLRKPENHG